MKKVYIILLSITLISPLWAQGIDMQAHVGSGEGLDTYTSYLTEQAAYYTGACSKESLDTLSGNELFGRLNALMGTTCLLETGNYSYQTLRSAYVGVDRDLNTAGRIIGYYDGRSMDGTWDNGQTWNREHTWPQSKGANKDIPMGHDMQSVRPTSTAVNSDRGNTAYGEAQGYYDPNYSSTGQGPINNANYKPINMGSYRGDAARVILYDYLVYGDQGGQHNNLYNCNAQLLDKLGTSGVFESVAILLKWHQEDPPSLTEMVRNDGAQNYQGNRNPFIDMPEIAVEILSAEINAYPVTTDEDLIMWPEYRHTTSNGFVAYLTEDNGNHPAQEDLIITGTTHYTYDEVLGRLIITNTSAPISIALSGSHAGVENTVADTNNNIIYDILGRRVTQMEHGQIYIRNGHKFVY